ncbi:uncharacterized protein LOC124796142 [Schistocerca piceifrons]|uniref:uncharacterized protein LOC124796142 n=1 Tax=Schistocerca piceifrons TaxID=274613 RepID=UPI001F5E54A6|nr:uncharacterized protein LOC124796142 [Schistocerca piceifrons]
MTWPALPRPEAAPASKHASVCKRGGGWAGRSVRRENWPAPTCCAAVPPCAVLFSTAADIWLAVQPRSANRDVLLAACLETSATGVQPAGLVLTSPPNATAIDWPQQWLTGDADPPGLPLVEDWETRAGSRPVNYGGVASEQRGPPALAAAAGPRRRLCRSPAGPSPRRGLGWACAAAAAPAAAAAAAAVNRVPAARPAGTSAGAATVAAEITRDGGS